MAEFLGFGVYPSGTARQMVRYAQLAEELGLHSFWLGEGYHGRNATVLLSAIAAATERIGLGYSMISVHTRHPALIAMEAATLAELSGGRFTLGLGVNTTALIKHGMASTFATVSDTRPVAALSDAMTIIRGLLEGTLTVHQGKVFSLALPGSRLSFPEGSERWDVPIYVGATGPRLIKVAGAMADGLILSRGLSSSAAFVRHCEREVRLAAKAAGRDPSKVVIAANLNFSVDEDPKAAREAVKSRIAMYVGNPYMDLSSSMVRFTDLDPGELDPVRKAMALGELRTAIGQISDRIVDRLSIAGTAAHCIARLLKLKEAGLQMPIAYDVMGPDKERAMKIVAERVIPAVYP